MKTVTIRFEDRKFWITRLTEMVAHQAAHEQRMHEEYLQRYEEEYNRGSWFFKLCHTTPAAARAKKHSNPFSPAIELNRMLKVVASTYWTFYAIPERDYLWISQWKSDDMGINPIEPFDFGPR